jgi:hypothetical protein
MKLRRLLLVGTLVLLALAMVVVPVTADGKKTYVTGTIQMQPCPFPIPDDTIIQQWPNGNMLDEGYSWDITKNSDPRLVGNEFWHYYMMIYPDKPIKWWGTLELFAGKGSWTGTVDGIGLNNYYTVTINLDGNFIYRGLKAKLVYTGYQEGGNYNRVWNVTGYILEKGSKR